MKWNNTKEGLVTYDAQCRRLNAALEGARDESLREAGEVWMKGHEDALTQLRAAFYRDTMSFNSINGCMVTTVSDMRLFVKMGG